MKKKIVWLTVSCSLVVALLLAACAPPVTEEEEVAPPVEKAPTPTLPRVSIGETWQGIALRITISEATVTDSYQYYSMLAGGMATEEASPGKSLLIATVEVKNISDQTRLAGLGMIRALDSEGSNYGAVPFYSEEFFPVDKWLVEGANVKGTVLFRIREGASGLVIRFLDLAEWEIK